MGTEELDGKGVKENIDYKKVCLLDSKKNLLKECTKYEIREVNKSFEERYKNVIKRYPRLSRLFNAMKATNFFPEPEVIEYFLKMWTQESSLSWSPKMDYSKSWMEWRKKQEIKKNLDFMKEKVNSLIWILWYIIILNEDYKKTISELISKLNLLYRNKNATEYDFYVLTQQITKFLIEIKSRHNFLTKTTPFEIDKKINELKHTPSSFGIWQINVDLFLEKIKKTNKFN